MLTIFDKSCLFAVLHIFFCKLVCLQLFAADFEADFAVIQAVNGRYKIESGYIDICCVNVFPTAQALRHKVFPVDLPNIVGFARLGKEACGVAVTEIRHLSASFIGERSAVKIALGDVLRHIKASRNVEGFACASVFLNMNNGKFLGICEPHIAVGVRHAKLHSGGVTFGKISFIHGIFAEIVVSLNIRLVHGISAVIKSALPLRIYKVVFLFNLFCDLRAFHLNAVFVNRLAVSVHQIIMNQNRTAVNRYLRHRESAVLLLVLVVDVIKGCKLVCRNKLTRLGYYFLFCNNSVFHNGRIVLVDVAHLPNDFFGFSLKCCRSLADINIRISGIVSI